MNVMISLLLLGTFSLSAAAQPFGAPAIGQPVEAKRGGAIDTAKPPLPPGVRDLNWEDLVPKDWSPQRMPDKLGLKKLEDNDPRANEILAKIRADWDKAPVVKALDGQKVRLPGFVVMLEGDEKGVTEFLLVPYFGACIHVPPPPSNQLVHVIPDKRVPDKTAMYPVWVTGTLTNTQADTKMGSAGYRIKGAKVDEYFSRR